MHCHVLIPGLPLLPIAGQRAVQGPALEILLARGSSKKLEIDNPRAWLCRSFGVANFDDPPIAALTLLADGGSPGGGYWLRSDPVHFALQRNRMLIYDSAFFAISSGEAQQLVEALDTHFLDLRLCFTAPSPTRWYMRSPERPRLRTHPLPEVVGRDVCDHMPSDTHAARWHGILNEIQMVLNNHPVNARREARSEPAINSVWLWGGGLLPESLNSRYDHVWANDVLARGLAAASNTPWAPLPELRTVLAARATNPLIVLDAPQPASAQIAQWTAQLEREWIAPLKRELACGRLAGLSLYLIGTGSAVGVEIRGGDLWKLWRRRPALPGIV
ncbi:MAG: hypothetical protein ACREUA_05370 [Burkholderiales bacterium]